MKEAPEAANASTTAEKQGDNATFYLGLPKVVDESSRLDATHELPNWDIPDIQTFLERPVRLLEIQWQVGKQFYDATASVTTLNSETSGYQFDPWTLLLTTPSLRHKLDQFAYLQADLHLKFVMTSSAHHYGALRCSYIPYGGKYSSCGRTDRGGNSHYASYLLFSTNGLTNATNTGGSGVISPTMTWAFDTFLSTFPGVEMQPGEMEIAELVIPFHSHNNWINLVDTTNRSLGVVSMKSHTMLRAVSSTASQVLSVTVYGWFDKPKVKGSTFYTTSSTQKRRTKTEVKKDGVVSGPASAVADMAGMLSTVPIIGPFAKATEIGAGAAGDIAKLFGFCAPPDITAPQKVRQEDWIEMAPINRANLGYVLSADPQVETTVDPGIAGLGSEDQMAFSYICAKPCLLAQPIWKVSTSTTASTGQYPTAPGTGPDVLFIAPVTPLYSRLGAENASGTSSNYLAFYGSAYSAGVTLQTPEVGDWDVLQQTASKTAFKAACWQPTPMCHVARMFHYWRGTLCFKVQVIASKFHSGTIMLSYDPQDDTISASSNLRVNKIVDISETKEITFKIPWCSAKSYLEVDPCSNFAAGAAEGALYSEPIRDPTYISGGVLYQNYWPQYPGATTWDTLDSVNFIKTKHADGKFLDTRVHNGIFTISIVNDLLASSTASIGSNADVQLLVWSWGEDMEFAVPSNRWFGDTYSPYPREGVAWNAASESLVYMGERLTSARQLVKKETLAMTCSDNSPTSGYHEFNVPFYPIAPKTTYTYYDALNTMWPIAANSAGASGMQRKAFHNNLVTYLSQCYMGVRGGMRYKFVRNSDGKAAGSMSNASGMIDQIVNRRIEFSSTYPPLETPDGSGGFKSTKDRYYGVRIGNDVVKMFNGLTAVSTNNFPIATAFVRSGGDSSLMTTFTHDMTRPTYKFAVCTVPYQQGTRFRLPCFLKDSTRPYYTDFTDTVEQVVQVYVHNLNNAINYSIDVYVSAAEDFNLLWFLAAPPIFKNLSRF